jgi:hypothetical protein
MSYTSGWLLCAIGAIWAFLVAVKATRALRRAVPYTFALWDGGILRDGKSLSRRGTQVKLFVGIAFLLCCVVVVGGIAPARLVVYPASGVAVVSVISDMLSTIK